MRDTTATGAGEREASADPTKAGSGLRLRSLDAVRVALAFAVLAYHLSGTIALEKYFGVEAFAHLFSVGDARIPFFFVLSGFLLTLLHGDRAGSTRVAIDYVRRRALRIFPTYWVVLLLVIAATLLLPGYSNRLPADPWVLAKAFLLIPQAPEVAGPTGAPLVVVAWTLHYELVWYAVFGAFLAHVWLGTAGVALLAANFLACHEGTCGFYRDFLASPYLVHFAIGAVAALVSRRLAPSARTRAIAWLALAGYFVLAALQYVVATPWTPGDSGIAFALVAGVVLACLAAVERDRPTRRNGVLALLADSSYALYLLHFPALSALLKLLTWSGLAGPWGATTAFVLAFAACVAAAVAFHRWIETPLLARLRRRRAFARPFGRRA